MFKSHSLREKNTGDSSNDGKHHFDRIFRWASFKTKLYFLQQNNFSIKIETSRIHDSVHWYLKDSTEKGKL